MKIIYFRNVGNSIEDEIESSLKKYNVKSFDIKNFDIKELLKECEDANLFLFHGTVIADNDINFLMMTERLKVILMNVKCKKVLWFLDKVWSMNAQIVDTLLPFVDTAYFVDETWTRRTKETNVKPLHLARSSLIGEKDKKNNYDIAYIGTIYGGRKDEFSYLKEVFGERIKFFDNKFGKELSDLCASTKIMIVPRFPFDDFYWDEKIYEYMNNGAFVVCPRAEGLKEEGFENGVHYMTYHQDSEIVTIVMEALKNDEMRETISQNGKNFVKDITYKSRIKEIMKNL